MSSLIPKASIVLDARTILKDGSHPLKLKVGISKNDSRKYSIGLSFSKEEYQILLANATKAPYKDIWIKIDSKLRKADNIIKDLLPFFRYKDFKERYFDSPSFKLEVEESSLLYASLIGKSCPT